MPDRRTFLAAGLVASAAPGLRGSRLTGFDEALSGGGVSASSLSATLAATLAGTRADDARPAIGEPAIRPAGTPMQVPTRAILATMIVPAADMPVYLTENGREGVFVWRAGDFSASVAIDPAQAIYVASSLATVDRGCWIRPGNGPMLGEWFGMVCDGSRAHTAAGTDNSAAIQHAVDLAQITQRALLLPSGTLRATRFETGPFVTISGNLRRTTIIQTPGSTVPLWGLKQDTVSDYCTFAGMEIIGNGVASIAEWVGAADLGLWHSRIERNLWANAGKKILWLDAGADGIHQFLTFTDNQFVSNGSSDGRSLSMTGAVEQVYFVGHNEFDCGIRASGPTNVCLSRRYPEGDYADHRAAGGTSAPLGGNAPTVVDLPMTCQGGEYGIVTDAVSAVTIRQPWFEGLQRAVTCLNGSRVMLENPRFANACSDRNEGGRKLGRGYGIGKDASSRVIVRGAEFLGSIDAVGTGGGAIVTLDGSSGGWGPITASADGRSWEGLTSGIVELGIISGGVLHVGDDDLVLLPAGASASLPATFTAIEAPRLMPGRKVTLVATGPALYLIRPGSNMDSNGRSIRLRAGDRIEIACGDDGTRYRGVPVLHPLIRSTQPRAGEMSPFEFCLNELASPSGNRMLTGWRCLGDGSIVPVHELVA